MNIDDDTRTTTHQYIPNIKVVSTIDLEDVLCLWMCPVFCCPAGMRRESIFFKPAGGNVRLFDHISAGASKKYTRLLLHTPSTLEALQLFQEAM